MVKLLPAIVSCVNELHTKNGCLQRTSKTITGTLSDIVSFPLECLVSCIEGREVKSSAAAATTRMDCSRRKRLTSLTDLDGDEATKRKQKRRIIKNLLVLTIVFVLVFVAYNGLSSLQSVLFPVHSLGTLCQGITYFSYVLSSLFLPRIFIVKFGQKWSIILGTMGYMTWMAANGIADWYTLGITSAIVGISAAPLWTSQASYITKYATLYARLNNEEPQHVIARFFGIFGAVFGTSKLFSSLSAAYILTTAGASINSSVYLVTEEDLLMCGRNDCPGNKNATQHNHNYEKVDDVVLWSLVSVYLITAVVAIVLAVLLLDPVPAGLQDPVSDTSTMCRETLELLTATLTLLIRPQMILLIPLIMTPGMDFAFFNADWARSYITCAVGMSYVGWTTFPQGLISIPIQIIGGLITKPFGRMPLIIGGTLILLVVNIIQLVWMPRPDAMWMFYFISLLYGIAGIGTPAKDALIGTEFHDCTDAAFANIHVWSALGGSMAFSYSTYLCISTKLYILLTVLTIGIFGYIGAEILFRRKRKPKVKLEEQKEDEFPLMEDELKDLAEDEEEETIFSRQDDEEKTEGNDDDDDEWSPHL